MGKIVYIIGRSSTGKDTIFKHLISDNCYNLKTIVSYTSRPIREGEKNGSEYFFVSCEQYEEMRKAGKIIEERCYNTIHGPWHYFTADDGQIDLSSNNYITIGTIESYTAMRDYYGSDNVIPVLIELDEGLLLQRALNREKKQEKPKYEEMCRRFLADSKDFSEEKIKEAGIDGRFINNDLDKCLKEIREHLKRKMG